MRSLTQQLKSYHCFQLYAIKNTCKQSIRVFSDDEWYDMDKNYIIPATHVSLFFVSILLWPTTKIAIKLKTPKHTWAANNKLILKRSKQYQYPNINDLGVNHRFFHSLVFPFAGQRWTTFFFNISHSTSQIIIFIC